MLHIGYVFLHVMIEQSVSCQPKVLELLILLQRLHEVLDGTRRVMFQEVFLDLLDGDLVQPLRLVHGGEDVVVVLLGLLHPVPVLVGPS